MSDFDIAIQNSLCSFKEEQEFQKCLELSEKTIMVTSETVYVHRGKQLREQNVRGDGNCLFRCIAIEMYDSEKHHGLVRQNMINFVQGKKSTYQSSANLGESLDVWIGKMSNCGSDEFRLMGEFGDAFALELLSWMLERPIEVSMRTVQGDQLLHTESMGSWFDKPTLHLILRGQHYTLLA